MNADRRSTPELEALTRLYYTSPDQLGEFHEVSAAELPGEYRGLLANDKHMTVTLESFHGCPVTIRVLDSQVTDTHYRRKVLVLRETDETPVLFGLVRVTRSLMAAEVRQAIEGEKIPLGRILINHIAMRNVRLLSLWRIVPGEELARIFRVAPGQPCYGRTAFIYCERVPAIEVLEIVHVP